MQQHKIQALHYDTGEPITISVDGGIITAIEPIFAARHSAAAKFQPFAAPGLVDLQINGYAGGDFNRPPLPDELAADTTRRLWKEGVTAYYPTVITGESDDIFAAMTSIRLACERETDAALGIAGIHLEGPFISPEDGARGAHPKTAVRPPDWELFSRWQEAAGGRIRIVTLSPEWPNSADFIAKCAASGVIVSIGHTAATPDQIREAVDAGARMSTHLGNGAHLQLPRHPNYIWEQLAQDKLWSCVIADGFHLPDQVLKVIMKVKGEQALLVSDAVALSGMPPGRYAMPIGGEVVLTPQGKLHLAHDDRLLAGSAQMLSAGIFNLHNRRLAELADAWNMASVRPAKLMGLPSAAGLSVGAPADIVLFTRDDHALRICRTYKAGRLVYDEAEEL